MCILTCFVLFLFSFVIILFVCFGTGFSGTYVAQVSLELSAILLTQTPKCLDYRCEPPHLLLYLF